MNVPNEFLAMVESDIQRIDSCNSLSVKDKFRLHRELDGRYQACIKDWFCGMWGSDDKMSFICYSLIEGSDDSLLQNLEMMKAKLETYKYQMNAVNLREVPSTQVNVTTNVNVTLTFETARQQIEDMTALSREETDEILKRIDELEAISLEKSSRKTKWEKVKPIIGFVMDKGADVAVAILTLIIQMKLGLP